MLNNVIIILFNRLLNCLIKLCLDFKDIWHGLHVPEDADIAKDLDGGEVIITLNESLIINFYFW